MTAAIRETSTGVYRRSMADLVVEHHESPFTRRVRRRRFPIAMAIAIVEAVLVLLGLVPWWVAVVAGIAAVAVYAGFGREHRASGVRSATWIVAVSQLIVVLVPVAVVLIGLLALVGVVAFAAIALAVLLLDRR